MNPIVALVICFAAVLLAIGIGVALVTEHHDPGAFLLGIIGTAGVVSAGHFTWEAFVIIINIFSRL